jgi:histone deacetylase HOS3
MANNTTQQGRCGIFIQDACYEHQYIRSKDQSLIVERPERVYAVKIGIAGAIARLEQSFNSVGQPSLPAKSSTSGTSTDALVESLNRINISDKALYEDFVQIFHSSATIDLLSDEAVKFIHGDIDGDVYLENLKTWIADSFDRIAKGGSEIPDHLSQGDLYCA